MLHPSNGKTAQILYALKGGRELTAAEIAEATHNMSTAAVAKNIIHRLEGYVETYGKRRFLNLSTGKYDNRMINVYRLTQNGEKYVGRFEEKWIDAKMIAE